VHFNCYDDDDDNDGDDSQQNGDQTAFHFTRPNLEKKIMRTVSKLPEKHHVTHGALGTAILTSMARIFRGSGYKSKVHRGLQAVRRAIFACRKY
jgi:hypothetical protein